MAKPIQHTIIAPVTHSVSPGTQISSIQSMIREVRGVPVMLDRDLAKCYQVEVGQLNRQVKRNIERFPEDFMFQLTKVENDYLKCQIGISSWGGDRRLPYAFTENGIAMLSSVLRSSVAIATNIQIMRAFNTMRHFVVSNAEMLQRIVNIEIHQTETDQRISEVFQRLDSATPSKQGLFYEGQVFDAYAFVSSLIKKAQKRIVIIDNYIDESVLVQLLKRGADVSATIYTKQISAQLQLDITRYNAQYPPIEVKQFTKSHDRFLLIDDAVYLLGASLKDLGKKWFGFAKIEELTADELIKRI